MLSLTWKQVQSDNDIRKMKHVNFVQKNVYHHKDIYHHIKFRKKSNKQVFVSSGVLSPESPDILCFGHHKCLPRIWTPWLQCRYWIPASCRTIKKSNESVLRKRCYRKTDGQLDRAEFIGPSGRGGDAKDLQSSDTYSTSIL